MAVVSVKTLHDGWTGSFPAADAPTFKVVFLVEVDNPKDGNMTVVNAEGIPALGSSYKVGKDGRADVYLKSLSTNPVAGTRNLWEVTGSYGAPEKEEEEDPTEGVDEDGKPTEDPLKFVVSMSISTTRVTRDAITGTYLGQVKDRKGVGGVLKKKGFNAGSSPPKAKNGVGSNADGRITNSRPITNSVFSPFDPPAQSEYNRTSLKIKFNTLNTPKKILPYINSVNSKTCNIKVKYTWKNAKGTSRAAYGKFSIPKYAGRILGITTSPVERKGVAYHQSELEIEVDKLYTWRLDILDRGYATINKEKTYESGGTSEGKSGPVTDSVVTEDGFATREPILLDGSGNALRVQSEFGGIEGVYLRYGVYPELDWNIVGLNEPKKLQGEE